MARVGLLTAILVYAIDQICKILLIDYLHDAGPHILIPGFFRLVMVWNTGISFGIGSGGSRAMIWLFISISLFASVCLTIWLTRTRQPLPSIFIGMIIGGALGNATDRIVHGAVADFFDVYIGQYHWPAFNIADTAIVIGVVGLAANGLQHHRQHNKYG